MKIALLADIHGNDVAFEAVAQDMEASSIDFVVFLGDLVAKGAQPQECFDRLTGMKPLVWLKGNTEYWLDDAMIDIMPTSPENTLLLDYYDYLVKHMSPKAMDELISLKHTKDLKIGHYEGLCCHGSPRDVCEMMDPIEDGSGTADMLEGLHTSFVLSGHSHHQYDRLFKGIRMINPGSIGVSAVNQGSLAKYAVLDIGSGFSVTLKEVAFDVQRYARIAEDRGFPGKDYYLGQETEGHRTA